MIFLHSDWSRFTVSEVIVTGYSLLLFFFKMAARFVKVTEEEIAKIKEDSIPEKTKKDNQIWFRNVSAQMLNFPRFNLGKN